MQPRPTIANAKIVQAFRGEARAPMPLHPLEQALVVVACIHLCFLPWALGARAPWAQILSLVFGLGALVLAALPRRYEGELAPQGAFILHPWSRLLRFPVFWLGGLLFSYIACQALNSAYLRVTAGHYWTLTEIEHVAWLPSGVDAPFARMNAWRILVIWGGAWALGCALWIGLTRRVAVHRVLTILVANGALLALVGILQRVTGAKEVLWSITPVAKSFLATFFYENHGGAYFNLMVGIAVALLAWHHTRALRRMERSSPAPVFGFLALVLANLVFMSGARAAIILLVGFLIAGAAIYLIWRLRMREEGGHRLVSVLVGVGAVALIAGAAWTLNLNKTFGEIRQLADPSKTEASLQYRILARQATFDAFQAEPVTGWGAGSFRHVFPIFQRNYAPIYKAYGGMLSWDHAHNDYVQALAELGVVGFSLLALILGWALVKFCVAGGFGQPAFLLFAAGASLPLLHAWIDFPFGNCAILTTLCAAWILLLRWIELEQNR